MATHQYPVKVQGDFLEKITHSRPVPALAEFIWNSLDADARVVDVYFQYNELGTLDRIVIRDDGKGMDRRDAPDFFGSLGGSWKRSANSTPSGRFLHGRDGRGRFKAFSIGRVADWQVTYGSGAGLSTYVATMTASDMRTVALSDETPAPAGAHCGVTLTITEISRTAPSFVSTEAMQELTELFALYLSNYRGVAVSIDGKRIDPSETIATQTTIALADIDVDGTKHSASLEIVEWKSMTHRSLYLCNEQGFPLVELERRFHTGDFQFSAYLKTSYTTELQREGTLELAEMNPRIAAVANEAVLAIKDYFRKRSAENARSFVAEWKDEQIYPYTGEAKSRVEEVERQVFDIVAVNVAQSLPDFAATPPKAKALHLRLLKQAIEKSPDDLQLILGEVLKLPKRKQEEFAALLKDASLSGIISASKVVADRLRFLTGLEAILFDADKKQRLKERSQLHRILAQNCWIFGEEYNLSVDDRSLTAVLRKHLEIAGGHRVVDAPVRHVTKERGIVDLVLSRAIKRHSIDEITHLVIELKAPKVKIGKDEILQVEEYAMSVAQDERFRGVNVRWEFFVISDDYTDYAKFRMKNFPGDRQGKIHEADGQTVWVKTWAQVLAENRARMQFFQERLEFQADEGVALRDFKERYAEFLEGVLVEDSDAAQAAGSNF